MSYVKLEESLSITTGRCDLAIATHDESSMSSMVFVLNETFDFF